MTRPAISEETPIICPVCAKVLGSHVLNFDTPYERRAKHEAIDAKVKEHQASECGKP